MILLLNFLDSRKIDITERIYSKDFLSISELDELRHYAQKKASRENKGNLQNLVSKKDNYVTAKTQYLRLTVIYKYIEWLSLHIVSSQDDFFIERLKLSIKHDYQT